MQVAGFFVFRAERSIESPESSSITHHTILLIESQLKTSDAELKIEHRIP